MAGNWNSGRKPKNPPVLGEYQPPMKPADLDGSQRWLWDTVVTRLIEQQVVERGDEDALQMMLDAWSAFQGAMKSRDIAEAVKSGDFYRKLRAQFGVNRVSRSKIGVPAKAEKTGIKARERR